MSVNPKTGCAQPTRDKGTTAEDCNDAYTGNISSTGHKAVQRRQLCCRTQKQGREKDRRVNGDDKKNRRRSSTKQTPYSLSCVGVCSEFPDKKCKQASPAVVNTGAHSCAVLRCVPLPACVTQTESTPPASLLSSYTYTSLAQRTPCTSFVLSTVFMAKE